MNAIINIVIIASAVIHAGMLVYALLHVEKLKTGRQWLPTNLALHIIAILSYFIPPDVLPIPSTLLTDILLIAAFTAFSGMVASDLTRNRATIFLGVGGVWILSTAVLGILEPAPFDNSIGILEAITTFSPSIMALIAGFTLMNVLLLAMSFYTFYVAPLSEVSNRALFWVFNSTIVLTGFSLAVSGSTALILMGFVVLTVGNAAATYSQLWYRVFDIRNLLGLVFRVLLLITVTALAVFGALSIIDNTELSTPAERTIFAGVLALAIAIMYVPIRELANYLILRMLIGETTDAIDATRRYSQELSSAIEINELIDISARTLNSVLKVRRSGMLLVSEAREEGIELTTMTSTKDEKPERVFVSADNPIYKQIVLEQKPLTQFDVVFNPLYETLQPEVRQFFRDLEMSAYAPIMMDNAIIGLLACGTKINDTPLYQRDLELLAALANQTGVALRNTRLVADLRHLNKSMQALNQSLGNANNRMGKLDSVKTDFVTIASHELRTPLAQVRGYTDIIDALNDQGMLDQDQTRGLVNNLRKATERMEELIAAMLDVSQLDVNAMDLRFAQTSPESVLRMAIEPLTDPIKQRKLTLSARGLRGLPHIEADMQRLVQAFRNIITNSIKFTPDGGRIDIHAQFIEASNDMDVEEDHILISISDTGIGIDRQHLELIFSKFYRASDPSLHSTGTYKFMGAGPGLGLTIAKGVIEGHGGRIWVESPGFNMETTPGSTFLVKLPLTPPENARRVLPFEEKKQEEANTNKRSTQQIQAVK